MSIKKSLLLSLLIITCSCNLTQQKGIPFKIANNADAPITDIKISTSENLDSVTFESLEENESLEGFLPMKNNAIDGSYTLTFKRNDGSIEAVGDGYYTNGAPLDSYIRFEVRNDTTLVKFGEFPN